MSFDPSIFFPAFKAAGFLRSAAFSLAGGATYADVSIGFTQPDVPAVTGLAQSREYEIEYETAAAPSLARGDAAVIDGVSYKLREDPRSQGDGHYSKVLLTRL